MHSGLAFCARRCILVGHTEAHQRGASGESASLRVMQTLSVIGAAIGLSAAALAADADLVVFENDSGGNTTGLKLVVEATDGGTHVDLKFKNDSTLDSTLSRIYIEATTFASDRFINGQIVAQSAGVSFHDGAKPPNPPGSISGFGGSWEGNLYSAGANPPPAKNGIDPGEYLTVRLTYTNGATFADVVNGFADPDNGLRIAGHVISVGKEEFSIWVVNIPSPAGAAVLGLAGLGCLRRRR
jgi:hypothetical protein